MWALDGRAAIVTGGGTGLGRVFAMALAEEGAQVAIADIRESDAESTAEEIAAAGGVAVALGLDQSDPASVDGMVRNAEDSLGPVSILLNNASLFSTLERRQALDITPEAWTSVVQTNLNGAFFCCRAALPGMLEQGYGKIVNIASSAIFSATNRLAHYVAAKAGIVGMTRALAREYGDSGITVNCISPGATDSSASQSSSDYLRSKVGARSIQRVQTPDDLVGAVIFLCSPMSDFVTGQNLVADGGGVFQ